MREHDESSEERADGRTRVTAHLKERLREAMPDDEREELGQKIAAAQRTGSPRLESQEQQ